MNEITLKEENWFYCDVCDCVSYRYDCDCNGTACNAHGCGECSQPLKELGFYTRISSNKDYYLKNKYKNNEQIFFCEELRQPPSELMLVALQEISSYGKQSTT